MNHQGLVAFDQIRSGDTAPVAKTCWARLQGSKHQIVGFKGTAFNEEMELFWSPLVIHGDVSWFQVDCANDAAHVFGCPEWRNREEVPGHKWLMKLHIRPLPKPEDSCFLSGSKAPWRSTILYRFERSPKQNSQPMSWWFTMIYYDLLSIAHHSIFQGTMEILCKS